MAKDVFSTFKAADYCNSSDSSIKRYINSGKLKAYKTPGGHYRILKDDLFSFMKENNIPIPEKTEIVRKKILVVDDDEQVREGMAKFLRLNSSNFDVYTAEDGFDAGTMIMQSVPDLIILDLMMPRMDGFSVCEKIRSNPLTKSLKLLVLTGYADEKNIKKAYECGADKVLEKPIEKEELLNEINSLI